MPSGARKRKAAKKNHKKLKPTPPSSANLSSTTQGDEDLKHHESDGGHNTNVNNGVEKSTDMKNGSAQMEKGAGQDGGVVQDEGESKLEKNVDSSSSGTSSDSDGSQEVEEKITISENAPVIDLVEVVISASEGPVEATHTTLVTKESARLHEVTKEVSPKDHNDEEKARLPELLKELEPEDKKNDIVDITSIIRPAKATSWKSCCGLFEAFALISR